MNKLAKKGYLWLCVLALSALLIPSALSQQSETLTIATYFPSPYGAYNVVRLFPVDPAQEPLYTPGASCANAGEMYFNGTESRFYLCTGAAGSTSYTWQPFGGSCQVEQASGSQDVVVPRSGTYTQVVLPDAIANQARFVMVYAYALSPPLPPAAQNCTVNDCNSDAYIYFKASNTDPLAAGYIGGQIETGGVYGPGVWSVGLAGVPPHQHYFNPPSRTHAFAGFALVPLKDGKFYISFNTTVATGSNVTIRISRVGYIM